MVSRYAQDLNLVSMSHLQLMLRQMLTKENIPNVLEWEDTLLKLALRIARELTFTAYPHRQGPDMDVRRYVKIKKIPGGTPKDSEYVDGAVITKNVSHKSMARSQRHPRVMLVTFPLEFSRVEGQYIPFGQIVRQEKEYMGNLVSRIAAYRPHVVLAEKSVSRLALDALAEQGIAVARSVKPSAIQFVARMSQADVFSSMDKLALEPRLGHCARFSVQTFDHPLIPGRRKTYMRFEGCTREMGCTIILRGGDQETLRRIKHVTRFLTFIVRSLKLETHLWKDFVIAVPALPPDAVPSDHTCCSGDHVSSESTPMDHRTTEADLPEDDAERLRLSRRIQKSLDPYLTTLISVSATLRFSPPYALHRMKELDDELICAKQAWEDEVVRREEKQPATPIQKPTLIPKPTDNDDVRAQIESLSGPDFIATPSLGETSSTEDVDVPEYFDYKPSVASSQITQSAILPASRTPFEEPSVLKTPDDIALESRYNLVKWQHQEQQRVWEWYLRKNADDFVVEKYQCISVREYTFPIEEYGHRAACFPPSLRYITYYGENDCTLGQFIESSIADTLSWSLNPKQPVCTGKGCNQPLARHCKIYVHNETKIFVAVEQWDGLIIGLGPTPELTTTWSACRICGSATPFIPVSEEMQRYSFAKFLELHFYPADVQLVQGAGCEHNIYRHHIRYFAKRGMTIRFQADPITLHEIVFPPMRIRVRPETQLSLKNADYERLTNRNLRWYAALVHDLNLIRMDAATGDEEIDAKLTADLNQLILRAESERAEVIRMVNEIYHESSPTDTLALNQVRSYLQDKIVAWQADFDKLPKPKGVRADKSGRQASSRFGTIWPGRFDLAGTYDNAIPSSGLSEAEDATPTAGLRRVKGGSFFSTPDASETEGTAGKNAAKGAQESEKSKALVTESPLAFESAASTKSDPDSDSTIGASKAGTVTTSGAPEPSTSVSVLTCERLSRHDTVLSRMLGARIAIPFLTWCTVRGFQDAKLDVQV
jgi:1-phosphatidylinositol-3-phosphate 5-kinase